ncbi:MAG: phage minor head protein [Actinomycetota bacterium]
MSVALLMAARVQETLVELAARKARSPAEIRAEAQLRERLAEVLGELIDRVEDGVSERGIPSERAVGRQLLGELDDLEEQLVEVLAEEVGEEALRAIRHVEEVVAAARKQLPDSLRPYPNIDDRLWKTLSRLGNRMLGRMVSRTTDALAAAAEVDMPVTELRTVLGEMLEGEITQLSRHAMGDARNEATETTERDLGVRRHRWVTAGDELVRPAHAQVDGEVVEVGERFSNGWRRPGGVGCRCRLEPVPEPEAA